MQTLWQLTAARISLLNVHGKWILVMSKITLIHEIIFPIFFGIIVAHKENNYFVNHIN